MGLHNPGRTRVVDVSVNMNLVVPPPLDNPDRPSEDELDGLLRAFYTAELPNPWPSFEAPDERNVILPPRPFGKRFPLWRTRLAWAACVAFLVAGPLALSTYLSGTNTPTTAKGTEAADVDSATANRELRWHPILKDNKTSIKVDVPYGPGK